MKARLPTPDEWTFEHRAALAQDMDQQLAEVIDSMVRLTQELLAEINVADHLMNRKIRFRLDEDEQLPF